MNVITINDQSASIKLENTQSLQDQIMLAVGFLAGVCESISNEKLTDVEYTLELLGIGINTLADIHDNAQQIHRQIKQSTNQ